MHTGTGSEDIAVEAMKIGLDDYVLKSAKHYARLPTSARLALDHAEQSGAFRRIQERFGNVLEQIPVVVYVREGRRGDPEWPATRYISPQIEALTGYSVDEWMAKPQLWAEIVHPDDRDALDEKALRVEEGRERFRADYRICTRDGDTRWIHDSAVLAEERESGNLQWQGIMIDVTEQEEAEVALRESDTHLRALFASMSDVVLVLDRDGRHVDIAPTSAELFRPPQELLGRTLHEILPGDVADLLLSATREALDTGARSEHQYTLPMGDRDVSFLAAATPMDDDRVLWVARDVTRRVEAEDALRETERRRTAIFESALEGIVSMDEHGHIVEFNRAAERMFGRPRESTIGQLLSDTIIPPSHRPGHLKGLARYLETGEASILGKRLELSGLRADGSEFPIELTVVRVEDAGVSMFTGFIRDITERRLAEQERAATEARYRMLVESGPAAVYMLQDLERVPATLTYISPQIERMLGYPVSLWMSNPQLWSEILHPDDRDRTLAAQLEVSDTSPPLDIEYRFVAADGREVWVQDRSTLVPVSNGTPFVRQGLLLDITEGRRTQRELARRASEMARLAEERQRILRKLVGAQEEERQRVALELHDSIGQVLTSVSLFVSDLEERVDEGLRPRVDRIRDIVSGAIVDTRQLVWSLRPPELERLGLVAALAHLVENAQGHGAVAVDLHAEIGDLRLPPEVETVVFRILQEALNNAVKHARAASISVVVGRRNGSLISMVEDDGRGFDQGIVATYDGGLGLIGMRERAELVGGALVVESSEGKGTVVRLEVPFA